MSSKVEGNDLGNGNLVIPSGYGDNFSPISSSVATTVLLLLVRLVRFDIIPNAGDLPGCLCFYLHQDYRSCTSVIIFNRALRRLAPGMVRAFKRDCECLVLCHNIGKIRFSRPLPIFHLALVNVRPPPALTPLNDSRPMLQFNLNTPILLLATVKSN